MLGSSLVPRERATQRSSCKSYHLNATHFLFSSCLNKDQHEFKTLPYEGILTIWEAFNFSLNRLPDHDWLGSRDTQQPGAPYVWKTWKTVAGIVDDLAHGY